MLFKNGTKGRHIILVWKCCSLYFFAFIIGERSKEAAREKRVLCCKYWQVEQNQRPLAHSKKENWIQMKIFLFSTLIYLHVYTRGARGQPFVYLFIILCVCWFGYAWSGNVPREFEVLVMRILNYVYLSLSLIIQMKKYFCCYLLIMQVGSCSQMKWKERYYF